MTEWIKENKNNGANPTVLQRMACSLTAGGIGAFAGNPADLVLVRMQADSLLPPDQRRNYKHVGDALKRIVAEEGITSLWKGSVPTVTRAMAANTFQLVSYDSCKDIVSAAMPTAAPMTVQVASSTIAAIMVVVGTLPLDNVKTKMQKQKPGPDGKMPYSSIGDCVSKTFRKEGITGFWSGLTAYYFRLAPHVIITLLASEQWRKIFKIGAYKPKKEGKD